MGYCLGCKGSRGLSQRVTASLFLFPFLRTVCVYETLGGNIEIQRHRPKIQTWMHVTRGIQTPPPDLEATSRVVASRFPTALSAVEKKKKKKKANKTSPRTRPRVSHPTPPPFHCASKEQNQNCINDISLWNLKIYTRGREKKKKEERICSPRFSTLRSEKGKINDRSIDRWNEARLGAEEEREEKKLDKKKKERERSKAKKGEIKGEKKIWKKLWTNGTAARIHELFTSNWIERFGYLTVWVCRCARADARLHCVSNVYPDERARGERRGEETSRFRNHADGNFQ